ncbi:MAG: hypothetical protein ACYDFT_05165 [Thermoplasmata archaeon]
MNRRPVVARSLLPMVIVGLLLLAALLPHPAPASAAGADLLSVGPLPRSATGPGPGNNSTHNPPGFSYTVNFLANGLPGGTQWGVILNGSTESSTSGEITFAAVPTGSVSYQILSPGDFAAQPSSGHLVVSGPAQVAVEFTGGSPPPPALAIPALELELLAGIGSAGILAVVVLELAERRRLRKQAHRAPE